jgi:SAM-dependent methyltransferase
LATKTYCIKDGYVHGRGNPTVETEPAYWNRLRVHTGAHYQDAIYRHAAGLVERHSLRSVLDVGCGVGHKLAGHFRQVAERVVGIDHSTCVEVARRRYPHLEFVAADLDGPPESGLETFDLIVAADVIEHLVDPDALLRSIHTLSHSESWIVLSTPERDVLRGEENLRSPKREHLREWTRAELVAYLTSSGFRIVEQRVVPAYRCGLSPVMWAYRLRDLVCGVPRAHCQLVVCRPIERGSARMDGRKGGARGG